MEWLSPELIKVLPVWAVGLLIVTSSLYVVLRYGLKTWLEHRNKIRELDIEENRQRVSALTDIVSSADRLLEASGQLLKESKEQSERNQDIYDNHIAIQDKRMDELTKEVVELKRINKAQAITILEQAEQLKERDVELEKLRADAAEYARTVRHDKPKETLKDKPDEPNE